MASYTSFGTRKALGKRYSQDPALLLEAERLQQEYGLLPAREALAFKNKELAQQQSQFDEAQSNAKTAGMVGTAANLATTGGMLWYLGKPPAASAAVTTPAAVGAPMGMTIPAAAQGAMPASSYASYMPAAGGYSGISGVTPYTVNPALVGTEGTAAGGFGAAGAGGAAPAGAMSPVLAYGGPAAAGYAVPKMADYAVKDFNENLGHTLTGGIVKDEGTAKIIGRTASGAAAGAAMGSVIPGVGTAVGGVVGGAAGLISSIFGW